MNDKTKPAKPALDKSEAGVAATLASCGLKTDDRSAAISTAIISGNLVAEQAKDKRSIIGGARVPENVGQCVADHYLEKPPSTADKLGSAWTSLVNKFTSARDSAVVAAKEEVSVLAPAVTNSVTDGSVDKIRQYNTNNGIGSQRP